MTELPVHWSKLSNDRLSSPVTTTNHPTPNFGQYQRLVTKATALELNIKDMARPQFAIAVDFQHPHPHTHIPTLRTGEPYWKAALAEAAR